MEGMQDTCHCPFRGSHIQAQDTFTDDVLREFLVRCRPSCSEVYGREPRLGERVAKLAGCYPHGACRALADINAAYIRRPARARAKPSFAPPLWVAELATSLDFNELFRYRFKKPGHINILEQRALKSVFKVWARIAPSTRAVALLDSKVVLGANAKGRAACCFSVCCMVLGTVLVSQINKH